MPTEAPPRSPIDVETIYLEPAVRLYERGRAILGRFPDARRVEVRSHWNIPGLHGNEGSAEDWLKIKRSVLVLGVRKTLDVRPNGRSADFIAPSYSNGCALACSYCYVPRRKGYANPISTFVNIEDMTDAIARHARKLGPKSEPNQVDPREMGLRRRRERRLLRRRPDLRQRPRPRRPLPRPPRRQGLVRHQVRQPRPPRLRPAEASPGSGSA